jgi:hypothetical protein
MVFDKRFLDFFPEAFCFLAEGKNDFFLIFDLDFWLFCRLINGHRNEPNIIVFYFQRISLGFPCRKIVYRFCRRLICASSERKCSAFSSTFQHNHLLSENPKFLSNPTNISSQSVFKKNHSTLKKPNSQSTFPACSTSPN